MKKIVVIALLTIVGLCAYSQKIVVGVLERAPTNNNRQDYYYTISTGSGSERELKQAMENKLKQNPQYNWMKDFPYAYVGFEGEYYVTIIKYNNKFGVGIGNNDSESLERAIRMIKSFFYLNTVPNYETIYSADFSGDMNKPPEKPYLVNPSNGTTISTTSVELKWTCNDPDNDELTYEILFGKEGEYLVNIAKDYHSNSLTKTGLLRGEKYNWRVIVTDGKAEKKWTDGSFYTSNVSSVNTTNKTVCPVCNGKGKVLIPESYKTCERCNGTGWYPPNKQYGRRYKCGTDPVGQLQHTGCGGTGKVKVDAHWEGCTRCNGTGYIDN